MTALLEFSIPLMFVALNFVAVTLLLFKPPKDTATMINLRMYTTILDLPCSGDRSLIFF